MEESELRFRSAFNSAAIGMAIVSLEGMWLKVNQSLCQIVGYSEEELLETNFQSITYPEDLELDLGYVRQLLEGDIRFYHMEKRYIHKNGSIIWILLSASLIRDPENKPLYFISQIQNIDAQKRAEQELQHIAYHDIL
ncbi:TPA: PAS domain S-box protein, partial [Legionella pneumophila]|nr:PAS domain S-box protein [Legionella pneumophila]